MKNILLLMALVSTSFLFSQEKLLVEYESKVLMDDAALEKIMEGITVQAKGATVSPEIARALAESMNKPTYYELRLTPAESEYKMVERISNEQPREDGIMVKVVAGSQGVTYKNLNESLILRTDDSWNKNYLISDSLKIYDWKITRESKELLGYEVRKATAEIDEDTSLEAWYAPKLTYKNGPDDFQGLPGLILEVIQIRNDEDGETKFVHAATSITVDKDNSEIKRPTKGKKVTQKEFEDILKEQSEKMKDMYGGGVDVD